MKIIKKCIAILLYLLLMALILPFDLAVLFDWKQIILVMMGTVILYLPHIGGETKHPDRELIGQSAMMGGLIACFVLLFAALYKSVEDGSIFTEIALACRPLFYGFCIWLISVEGEQDRQDQVGETVKITLEDSRKILQEMGLTARETEVSLLVIQGFANKEIAQELYISETTVKKHLSNIFAKLEISAREELRARVEERAGGNGR